jgi:hypothetical protein
MGQVPRWPGLDAACASALPEQVRHTVARTAAGSARNARGGWTGARSTWWREEISALDWRRTGGWRADSRGNEGCQCTSLDARDAKVDRSDERILETWMDGAGRADSSSSQHHCKR